MRTCPACHEPGIDVSMVYPEGSPCEYCGEHVEIDMSFVLTLIVALIVLTILDARFWGTGYVGIPCGIMLVLFGVGPRYIYPRYMPLKCYFDE